VLGAKQLRSYIYTADWHAILRGSDTKAPQQHLRAALQPPSAVNLHQSSRTFHQHPPGPKMKAAGSRICVALAMVTIALYAQSARAASCLFTSTECQCSESVSASKCVHVVSKKGNQHMCEAGACSAGFRCVRPVASRQNVYSILAPVLRQPTDHASPASASVCSLLVTLRAHLLKYRIATDSRGAPCRRASTTGL
jgi:hypothetical protein